MPCDDIRAGQIEIRNMSRGEAEFELLLKAHRIPFQREYRFHPVRRWRFDFVILKTAYSEPEELKIAVEIEGGIFVQGRHNRGLGMQGDCVKYNAAQVEGWRVLRYTTGQIHGQCIDDINDLMNAM